MDNQSIAQNDTREYTTKEKHKNNKRRQSRRTLPSFASDVHGAQIRNAVTGSYYEERIGTLKEKKFFKVSGKSSFKMNSDGVVLDEGYNMSSFYYDNPEQYEKHKNVVVSQAVKDKWRLNADAHDNQEDQPYDINHESNDTASEGDDIGDMLDRLKTMSN